LEEEQALSEKKRKKPNSKSLGSMLQRTSYSFSDDDEHGNEKKGNRNKKATTTTATTQGQPQNVERNESAVDELLAASAAVSNSSLDREATKSNPADPSIATISVGFRPTRVLRI
jgi:hypothetical protein